MSYQIHPVKVHFTFFKNFSYLITDLATKETALVDPTWEFNKINSVIADFQLNLTTILQFTLYFSIHINIILNMKSRKLVVIEEILERIMSL